MFQSTTVEFPSDRRGFRHFSKLAGRKSRRLPFNRDIRESLDQDYYFGVLALSGVIGPEHQYKVAYTGAYSTLQFNPDPIGDLIYEGGASNSFRSEFDNTLQTGLYRVDFDWHNAMDRTTSVRVSIWAITGLRRTTRRWHFR